MQYDNHETDLYILPENPEERKKLMNVLKTSFSTLYWCWAKSDVKGQAWEGKMFVDIPCGIDLKQEIINILK